MMKTTTVEDSEDWENLKALKNSQICMTQEGYLYGTWQTMDVINTEIKVYQRKTGAWRVSNSKFCQENPKAGVINSWK